MNETSHLDLQNNFHQTICKLRAMADFLPRALEDGEALLRGAENGVGYILEDIIKEMEQFNAVCGICPVTDRMNAKKNFKT